MKWNLLLCLSVMVVVGGCSETPRDVEPPEAEAESDCPVGCADGDSAVAGEEACLQDDAVCYAVDACGVEQWCTGPADCELACEEGHAQIGSPNDCLQDALCYSVEGCGELIWCSGEGDSGVGDDACTTDDECNPGSACINGVCVVFACESNDDCDPSEYCYFAPEGPSSGGSVAVCGWSGNGECRNRPGGCNPVDSPVCGCDQATYDNACSAARAGVSVMHDGACADSPAPTPLPRSL